MSGSTTRGPLSGCARRLAAISLVVIGVVTTGTASARSAAATDSEGFIAIEHRPACSAENPCVDSNPSTHYARIYRTSRGSTGLTRLRLHVPQATHPSFSADGKVMAFTGIRRGEASTYVMSRASAVPRRVATASGPAIGEPVVSPSGRDLVFVRGDDLWISRIDGTRARRLTTHRGEHRDAAPRFSPDGRSVVFTRALSRRHTTDVRIATVDVDGGRVRSVTRGPYDVWPSFSPDGSTIVFVRRGSSDRGYQQDHLMIVSADGGRPREIETTHDGVALISPQTRSPVFSPDGTRLAVSANFSGSKLGRHCWVFTLALDGSDLRCVNRRPELSDWLWWASAPYPRRSS